MNIDSKNVKKVAVLGGGAFGTALSVIAAKNAEQVVIWARDQQVVDGINQNHRHPKCFSQVDLVKNIFATNNLEQACKDAQVVILAIPMSAMEQVLAKLNLQKNVLLLSTAKGISPQTLMLPCDIIKKYLGRDFSRRACYLSGPSFAQEIVDSLPTGLTVASKDLVSAKEVQKKFSLPNFRLYSSPDTVGLCLAGALKNVIAIAAGACQGLGLGSNALAALITRGLREISRLGQKMGAKTQTMSGLAGIGDLLLSCTDQASRNNRLGHLLAQGYCLDDALKKIGSVVEGANTAKAIPLLVTKYKVDLPISMGVFRVLYDNEPVASAINSLLNREPKDESI